VGLETFRDLYRQDLFVPFLDHPNYLFAKVLRDELVHRAYKNIKNEFNIDLQHEFKTKPRTYAYGGYATVDPNY
jgi:hypothetical protein